MKTKHTQGDWRTVYEMNNGTLVKSGERPICKIYRNNNLIEINANAKLIAAAPEMLETLNYILPLLKVQFEDIGSEYEKEAYNRAVQIIKKATGENK